MKRKMPGGLYTFRWGNRPEWEPLKGQKCRMVRGVTYHLVEVKFVKTGRRYILPKLGLRQSHEGDN